MESMCNSVAGCEPQNGRGEPKRNEHGSTLADKSLWARCAIACPRKECCTAWDMAHGCINQIRKSALGEKMSSGCKLLFIWTTPPRQVHITMRNFNREWSLYTQKDVTTTTNITEETFKMAELVCTVNKSNWLSRVAPQKFALMALHKSDY